MLKHSNRVFVYKFKPKYEINTTMLATFCGGVHLELQGGSATEYGILRALYYNKYNAEWLQVTLLLFLD